MSSCPIYFLYDIFPIGHLFMEAFVLACMQILDCLFEQFYNEDSQCDYFSDVSSVTGINKYN